MPIICLKTPKKYEVKPVAYLELRQSEDKPQEGAIIQHEGALKRCNVLGKWWHF